LSGSTLPELLAPSVSSMSTRFSWLAAQTLYCQANGITDGGTFSRQTDGGFVELGAYSVAVKGEGCLQVSLITEQDKAETVARASFYEFTGDRLDSMQAGRDLPAEHHVLNFHAARNIHSEQQVAAADW